LFWRHGFGEVSVTDIEKETGVGRSSIYHAFGSMRGRFDAAVAYSLHPAVRPRLAGPFTAAVPPDALIAYRAGLRDAI
ncbi:TetR/AcrR family transcriptional regulator, partial [Mycobacterium tuberculosis]|nr:TetR/AcrR family transcriptional regulator [Mycobacterium tuberculosis]